MSVYRLVVASQKVGCFLRLAFNYAMMIIMSITKQPVFVNNLKSWKLFPECSYVIR